MKKYYFSVASVFKNESWGMKEWLDHYKFHGVDHVYLVNDFSTDNYLPILQPYIDEGFVTLYKNDNPERYTGRQVDINNKFFKPILKETQWLAQLDLDEFLYSPQEIDIKNILKKYCDYSAIVSNWVYFSSNGLKKQPKYVVEGFTKRCDYNDEVFMHVGGRGMERVTFDGSKIIVNTDYNVGSFNIHDIDVDGNKINLSYKGKEIPELLINHYQLQSREYWEKVKMNRGDVNHWFNGSPRGFDAYDNMDIGNIDDCRLYQQNLKLFV